MSKLNIFLPGSVAEYRHWYRGQMLPQDSYLLLDLDERILRADYDGEIGNVVTAKYFHNREIHFSFPCDAALYDVQNCMERIAPLCNDLLDTYTIEWDGNNWVGKYDVDLAEKIQSKVDVFLEDYFLTPAYEAEQEELETEGEE